jgi:nucleotide-binding universal stress UspA family protein
MYKTILVPLDGSERAEKILPHVEELARRFEAKVVLLQVIEPVPALISPYDIILDTEPDSERWRQEAGVYLALKREGLLGHGIDTAVRVEVGAVVRAIIQVAEEENADLIAMASHGRTAMVQVFYGSVASGVLNQAERPLLLIRSR